MKQIRSILTVSTLALALGTAPLSSAVAGGEVGPAFVVPQLPAPVAIPPAPPPLGPDVAAGAGIPMDPLIMAGLAAAALGLLIALSDDDGDETGRGRPISPS